MKNFVYPAALALLLFPACSPVSQSAAPDQQKQAEQARQERQEYADKAQAKLHELDQEIDALRGKMEKQKSEDRRKLKPQMADLDRKREELRQELKNLNSSSAAAWHNMEIGIDQAMDDLDAACKRAAADFK